MAEDTVLTELDYRAGAEYLKALQSLRFQPDVLCWSNELLDIEDVGAGTEKRLTIISSLVDAVGAKAIYELLFQAYDASATPKEINPFIVSIYSPKSIAGMQVLNMLTGDMLKIAYQKVKEAREQGQSSTGTALIPAVAWPADGMPVIPQVMPMLEGIYMVRKGKISTVHDRTRFDRFRQQVEKLAA